MNKGFMIYLSEEMHKEAKERAKALDISFSKYVAILVLDEITNKRITKWGVKEN